MCGPALVRQHGRVAVSPTHQSKLPATSLDSSSGYVLLHTHCVFAGRRRRGLGRQMLQHTLEYLRLLRARCGAIGARMCTARALSHRAPHPCVLDLSPSEHRTH